MDNSTVKETWIDKLVDELVDAKNDVSNVNSDYAYLKAEKSELEKANNRLIDTILDNTRLDYDGKDLRIDSDTALIYLLKIEYPDEYRERLEELKEIKLRKNKAKAEAAATEEEAEEFKNEPDEAQTAAKDPVEAARDKYQELIAYCKENDYDIKDVAKTYSLNSKSTAEDFEDAIARLVFTTAKKNSKEA